MAPRRGARAEQRAGWAAFQEGRLERALGAPREDRRGTRVRGPGVSLESLEGAGEARQGVEALREAPAREGRRGLAQ